ncbi:hypothetical protein SAMN05444169_6434 [Bradyrhizobium erythrophlei]|uniref:Uncharacterized protein n=1 Tax=Bradyrhizobium erythrophlei TaxID=1437360 RepID=A0A1M5RAC1_9BRAD|nr:hypothetical protein SAMN05444169_6434 [Bradyrhizobium erythrophlei]
MAEEEAIGWFFNHLFEPLFSHAEVLALVDELTHDTLQNWANRKYVTPKLVKGKRRYNALEVATVSLAQPLVWNLGMDPSAATLAVVSAMLYFHRKLKAKEVSATQVRHQMLAYTKSVAEAEVFDARRIPPDFFEKYEAFTVLAVGRLLNDLARKQRDFVEARRAN